MLYKATSLSLLFHLEIFRFIFIANSIVCTVDLQHIYGDLHALLQRVGELVAEI